MKNIIKLIGIIALASIIVFSMAACDDGDGGSTSSFPLGASLTFSGQTYVYDYDEEEYAPYTGNATVISNVGGTGNITAGQLVFTVGMPAPQSLGPIGEYFGAEHTISEPLARIVRLELLANGYSIHRENSGESRYDAFEEAVSYIYVDRDVTVSAKRDEGTLPSDGSPWISFTLNAYTINLKEGWNALHEKATFSYRTLRATITTSAANPSNLIWLLALN